MSFVEGGCGGVGVRVRRYALLVVEGSGCGSGFPVGWYGLCRRYGCRHFLVLDGVVDERLWLWLWRYPPVLVGVVVSGSGDWVSRVGRWGWLEYLAPVFVVSEEGVVRWRPMGMLWSGNWNGLTAGRWWHRFVELLVVLWLLVGLLPWICLVVLSWVLQFVFWGGSQRLFFCQVRSGHGFRPMLVWKVRTLRMSGGRSDGCRGLLVVPGDWRVLPGLAWARRLHIDEFPQLFLVLWGDMALVGPRPEQLGVLLCAGRYSGDVWWVWRMKPGLVDVPRLRLGYGWRIEHIVLRHCMYRLWWYRVVGQPVWELVVGVWLGVNGFFRELCRGRFCC